MRKRSICLTLAAALLLPLLGGCTPTETAATDEPAAEAVVIQTNSEPVEVEPTLFLRDDADHPALMTVKSDGCFHPAAPVTRIEFCEALFVLFDGLPDGRAAFSDLDRSDEGFGAVSALYLAGVLPDEAGGAFYPDRSVTRAYVYDVLFRIADGLGSGDAARARLIAIDMTAGLTAGEGARLGDNDWVARGELAVLLERLADRTPDEQDLLLNGCVPPDVLGTDGWAVIADAVTEGVPQPVAGGVYRLYGWLYAAWDDGTLVTDMDYGVWTFDHDGAYTTGSETLDAYLREALEASGANELEGEDALRAAYLYIKYNFEYMVRPEDMTTIPVGETGWEFERAERFFRYGGGTCYGYAAALCLTARALGYHAYAVAAQVNQYFGAHGFVVIPEGDEDVIYDVEMEATRPGRHADLELFGIRNYEIYYYWYTANWRQ